MFLHPMDNFRNCKDTEDGIATEKGCWRKMKKQKNTKVAS